MVVFWSGDSRSFLYVVISGVLIDQREHEPPDPGIQIFHMTCDNVFLRFYRDFQHEKINFIYTSKRFDILFINLKIDLIFKIRICSISEKKNLKCFRFTFAVYHDSERPYRSNLIGNLKNQRSPYQMFILSSW